LPGVISFLYLFTSPPPRKRENAASSIEKYMAVPAKQRKKNMEYLVSGPEDPGLFAYTRIYLLYGQTKAQLNTFHFIIVAAGEMLLPQAQAN